MKKIIYKLIVLVLLTNVAIATAETKTKHVSLSFEKIIVPEAPPVSSVMVAYMNIKNNASKSQKIIHIVSPQFKRVEIHEMSMENGMMNMQQLKSLSIKPKETIKLETGGLHIMLIKPIAPLKHNDKVELTFELATGELTTVSTQVRNIDLTNKHQHQH